MKKLARRAILALCFWALPTAAQAQFDAYGRWEHGFGEPAFLHYAPEESGALLARWERIGAQNRERPDEWAGDYVRHGELSLYVLRWSPRGGFAHASIHTCQPAVTDFAYGSASASARLVQLRTEKRQLTAHSHHGGGAAEAATRNYLPVRWGQRRYLVPESEVGEFYNFVAGHGWGADSWPRDFLVRAEDAGKPVSGMPVLPPGYERFVRRPVEATVTRVGRRVLRRGRYQDGTVYYDSLTPVTLDVGSAHGVRGGMKFYLIGSDYPETIEFRRIGRRTSTAVIERGWKEGLGEVYQSWQTSPMTLVPHVPVAAGSRLTTSFELYESAAGPTRR